jgi:ribokinase
MAGCVGEDDFGARMVAALAAESVDTSGIRVVQGMASGLALITVDAAGENMITVASGANAEVGTAELKAALGAARGPGDAEADAARGEATDVLVLCAEIPGDTLTGALARARNEQVLCVLNLAPAPSGAADIVASGVDWLVVNESEAAAVLGRPVTGLAEAAAAATDLAKAGARFAVVTAGAAGAALAGVGEGVTVPGFKVPAVDSVGAGDTFVGALAVALAAGVEPAEAMRVACAAGASAATRPGTQAAMPRPADVLADTGMTWPVRVASPAVASQSTSPSQ